MGRPKKVKKESWTTINENSKNGTEKSIKVNDIDINNYKKIDKLGNGMYRIELCNGSVENVSLLDGEANIIDQHLIHHSKDDVKHSDISSRDAEKSVELPSINLEALENRIGDRMNVRPVDPNHVFYWCRQNKIHEYLDIGYVFAKKSMVKFYESHFRSAKPGEGISPDGNCNINGLTLLVCTKQTQKAIRDFNYNKRPILGKRQFELTAVDRRAAGI